MRGDPNNDAGQATAGTTAGAAFALSALGHADRRPAVAGGEPVALWQSVALAARLHPALGDRYLHPRARGLLFRAKVDRPQYSAGAFGRGGTRSRRRQLDTTSGASLGRCDEARLASEPRAHDEPGCRAGAWPANHRGGGKAFASGAERSAVAVHVAGSARRARAR